jgi:hypothetical protein
MFRFFVGATGESGMGFLSLLLELVIFWSPLPITWRYGLLSDAAPRPGISVVPSELGILGAGTQR